jgi:putative addiction module killer protein
MKTIEFYIDSNGHSPYEEWLNGLDSQLQDIIVSHVEKLEFGLGDVKRLGEGLFELRIHFGPGYRIFFVNKTNKIVLILGGASKKDQKRTIRMVKRIIKSELERD